ncbi:MAG: TldE protein, part of TldE/TldD proteolytic complex [Candidatus Fermentimicrarchaeum limneticum]|uniref:TldE protein, part of TldE/TldD proteolytic complex n=1 Tax=Fermentimicrarchaeum limneticum TaxID=2795018 RepID=A0A7D6BUN1_FERL1|nr:MAG: TldE protein, part of TldE/TldD proteolytic complex [Candidatus Fermentimicrarchaeum limneticum]
MDFALLERIVGRAEELGADDVVAIGEEARAWQTKFVNNRIATGMSGYDKEVSLFVSKDRKIGVTTIKEFSRRSIEESVSKLLRFTKKMQPNEEYYGIAQGPFKYKVVKGIYDGRIGKLEQRATDFIEGGINAALAEGAKRASGVLKYNVKEEFLVTSSDARSSERSSGVYFSIRALADKDASGHKVCCSTTLRNFFPERTGARAGRIAKMALNPVKGSIGRYDVIFDPYPLANLLNIAMDSASAFAVEAGFSFLRGKLGRKVASSAVTLVDDGRLPHCLSSSKCDSEGVPTRRNVVIDRGILKTYLHNTSTAKRYGVETTGNAGLLSPKPCNAVLSKGDYGEKELFDEVKRGLYITNLWYTRFQNYETGDFSTIPRDGIFLIEKGELTKSLKEIRLSDNMLRMLLNVVAVSKKQEQIIGWEVEIPVITSHVLVKGVRVTKST